MDKNAGKKGKIAVYYAQFITKSPYCISISAPELFPHNEASKGDPISYLLITTIPSFVYRMNSITAFMLSALIMKSMRY
jgi:hypothetical protein